MNELATLVHAKMRSAIAIKAHEETPQTRGGWCNEQRLGDRGASLNAFRQSNERETVLKPGPPRSSRICERWMAVSLPFDLPHAHRMEGNSSRE